MSPRRAVERWWHVYHGHAGDSCEWGASYITVTAGASVLHPEQLLADGRLTVEFDGTVLTYVRSFNREPSDAEMEQLRSLLELDDGDRDG